MEALALNQVQFEYADEAEAFPDIPPGVKPLGDMVLVQIRQPKTKTRGGIILSGQNRDTEFWNTQVAKVLALGPIAYKDPNTMAPWPEGAWANPGDYVRIPRYGGDRWSVPLREGGELADQVTFVLLNHRNILGELTLETALSMKAFL